MPVEEVEMFRLLGTFAKMTIQLETYMEVPAPPIMIIILNNAVITIQILS